MSSIEFFMPMIVPTKTYQQKRIAVKNNKPVVYEDEKLKDVRNKFMSHLWKYVPNESFKQGVRLIVKWCFKNNGKHTNGEYKLTKPDTDNLQKLLKDCMTDLCFWKDDAQVASEIIEKFWADVPGIYIKVEKL